MSDVKNIIRQTQSLSLLYVEDEILFSESTIDMFQNFFSKITIARNGLEALSIFHGEESIDVIITDLSMPVMDGMELIEKIREDNKTFPIIVFSALNDPSYISRCIALGIDAYVLKPLKIENLLDALQKIVYKLSYVKENQTQAKELLKKYFTVDELTNLKSHSVLIEKLHNLSLDDIPIMALINIDDFHIYNELYGFDIGDEILQKFAQGLEVFVSNMSYEVYRMGGDEFALFEIVKYIDTERYENDMESLFEFIEGMNIDLEGVEEKISLGISVGISFDSDNSYGKAEMALVEARKRGRRYLGFSADADRRAELKNNLYWREEIAQAIRQERVHAFYQPIVNREEKVIKYESLMRIKQFDENNEMKLIAPAEFLDFSKISKQYIRLTKIMINESFVSMIKYNVHIAINLTFHDIKNKEINKLLHERIIKHHLASKTKFDISSQIIFELLAHSNHEDYDRFVEFVSEFKAQGVLITIDNFGLGFDNMSKIAALSPNYVKIDAILMKNIDSDKHAYALVKAVVKFAKELGIKTIAEHVSSKEIFEASKELGIDEFQGYYFGEPLELISEVKR